MDGPSRVWVLRCALLRPRYDYRMDMNEPALQRALKAFSAYPVISVLLPVHAADTRYLKKAVASVMAQAYPHWQLCVVDDGSPGNKVSAWLQSLKDERIRVHVRQENGGISAASNDALAMADGAYVCLLDHDDELTADALFHIARVINTYHPELIYSDEDIVPASGHSWYGHFKPDFSPELLLSHNYITHLMAAPTGLTRAVGGFRSAYDSAQDYDLALRLCERADRIVHIRRVLYHWRYITSSVSRRDAARCKTDLAGCRALEDALQRRRQIGQVKSAGVPHHYRIWWTPPASSVISAIFIGNPEDFNAVTRGLQNVLEQQGLQAEFLPVDCGEKADTVSAQLNAAAQQARGEYLLFADGRGYMDPLTELSQMAAIAAHPDTGAVGGMLCHSAGIIASAGYVFGGEGQVHYAYRGLPSGMSGYFHRLRLIHNVMAVHRDLMMVSRARFMEVGGFDAARFPDCGADADLCLRLLLSGYRSVMLPMARINLPGPLDPVPPGTAEKLHRRHADLLAGGDAWYHPLLRQDRADYTFRHPFAQAPVYDGVMTQGGVPV